MVGSLSIYPQLMVVMYVALQMEVLTTCFQLVTRGRFYYHGLNLIPAWISNYIHYNVWYEITYPFLNFNGATGEVYEHFTLRVITYPCWD